MRVALIVATFYEELAERLLTGARSALVAADLEVPEPLTVPGAFELPAVAQLAVTTGGYDAAVCLGAVIRGETDHYDFVCGETARGVMDVSLRTGAPCGFGVLTVDSHAQAIARTGGGKRDTGANAVQAVLAVLTARDALVPV